MFVFLITMLTVVHADMPVENCSKGVSVELCKQNNNKNTPCYKKGMFWLGCWNGCCLPWTYAIVMGLNLIDISDPAVEAKLKPFAEGATVGILFYIACVLLTVPLRIIR